MTPQRMLEAAAGGGATRAYVASAWMRRGGLELLAESLRKISDGGAVRFLVGEAFNMTSKEAVEEALRIVDPASGTPSQHVRTYLDRRGSNRRTYHPKVYLAKSEATAWLFVGSHNLTPGGMDGNYEAGLCVVGEPEAQVITDAQQWFEAARLASLARSRSGKGRLGLSRPWVARSRMISSRMSSSL